MLIRAKERYALLIMSRESLLPASCKSGDRGGTSRRRRYRPCEKSRLPLTSFSSSILLHNLQVDAGKRLPLARVLSAEPAAGDVDEILSQSANSFSLMLPSSRIKSAFGGHQGVFDDSWLSLSIYIWTSFMTSISPKACRRALLHIHDGQTQTGISVVVEAPVRVLGIVLRRV